MTTRDPMIWRELPETTDSKGHTWTPAVKREYFWTGTRRGVQCRIQCELTRKLADGVYVATALFAHNVAYLCRDRVKVEDLEPIR